MKKYLVILGNNAHYTIIASNWREALAKLFKYYSEWINIKDYSMLINDATVYEGIAAFNQLIFETDISYFGEISKPFIDLETTNIDDLLKGE